MRVGVVMVGVQSVSQGDRLSWHIVAATQRAGKPPVDCIARWESGERLGRARIKLRPPHYPSNARKAPLQFLLARLSATARNPTTLELAVRFRLQRAL